MQSSFLNATETKLLRLEDDVWAFKIHRKDIKSKDQTNPTPLSLRNPTSINSHLEIRLQTQSFQIASFASNIIKEIGSKEIEKLEKPVIFDFGKTGILQGKWKISIPKEEEAWFYNIKQAVPFTKMIHERNILNVKVEKLEDTFFSNFFKKNTGLIEKPSLLFEAIINHKSFPPKIAYFPLINLNDDLFQEHLSMMRFSDAFTIIASDAFQRWEPQFIHRHNPDNTYRIVLEGDAVLLKSNQSKEITLDDLNENQNTIKTYRNYLIREYGEEKLSYIEYEYGFSLNEMIKNGDSLTPEIVYRINIGSCNVEMQDVVALYKKLLGLNNTLKLIEPNTSLEVFFQNRFASNDSYSLTMHELRSIYRHLPKKTTGNLLKFLNVFLGNSPPKDCEDLDPIIFNQLVSLLFPSYSQLDQAYTGRKIHHKAIMGYYTLADKDTFKPWLDLQELLQTFPKMEKTNDWNNFYEMISHVAVKKHLIRRHPKDKWRVGTLIPGPKYEDGSRRWFRVDSCIDDNQGDFNYTLIPACSNYEDTPAIKLYRSTASDKYAMNGWESIAADLKLAGAPGAGNRAAADEYEVPFFYKRTIPIWVAYLINSKQEEASIDTDLTETEQFQKLILVYQNLMKAKNILLNKESLDSSEIPGYYNDENFEFLKNQIKALNTELTNIAEKQKELPKYKLAQDIAFVGHSLGGSLAQGGMFHFGPEMNRIPLEKCNFHCFAFDPPAITYRENTEFLAFGRKHVKLLNDMEQKWKIFIQMEYGDIVPQGGEIHLGSHDSHANEYESWLEMTTQVFKPDDESTKKGITTCPTHGRRIGLAQKDIDYYLTYLSPKDLFNFDNAWWLNKKQQNVFGYKMVNSPKISEIFRKSVAVIRLPLGHTAKIIWQSFYPPRGYEIKDKKGYLYVPYETSRRRLNLNLN